MLSNPFSRPTRTIFLLVVFLLGGMLLYHPGHRLPESFPHLDSETLHQYLNRSDHAQIPLAMMANLQKHVHDQMCAQETKVISSISHHYRTETTSTTVTATSTKTELIQPTCDGKIEAPFSIKGEATPEQLTVAKLREAGIVVVFKTGAQEVAHLAIQVGTTLRYMSNNDILFFSDQQGSVGPFLINDVLRNVNQTLKTEHPDFEIYREIKRYLATGQDILSLREDASKGGDRAGWRLDKYKFLHMVEEAFEMRPDAKWYMFIETDTYVFWDNLAEWVKQHDPKKAWYIGSQVQSGDVRFAHGGSGYILSNAAMNKLLGPDQPQGLAASWDARLGGTPFGDAALAIALREKGVELSVAHPLLNGYKPSTFTYGPGVHWCQPVVTMHHVLPAEVSSVWRYERQRELHGEKPPILFADLYMHFVEPHLVDTRNDWDNLSHGTEYSQKKIDEAKGEKEREEMEAKAKVSKGTGDKVEATKTGNGDEALEGSGKKEGSESADVKTTAENSKDSNPSPKDDEKSVASKNGETDQASKADELKPDPGNGSTADPKDDNNSAGSSADEGDPWRTKIAELKKDLLALEDDLSKRLKSDNKSPESEGIVIDLTTKIDELRKTLKYLEESLAAKSKEGSTNQETEKKEANDQVDGKSEASSDAEKEEAKKPDDEVTDPPDEDVEAADEIKNSDENKVLGSEDTLDEDDIDPQAEISDSQTKGPPQASPQRKKRDLVIEKREAVQQSDVQAHAHESFENCGKACEEDEDCFQWVFTTPKTCKLGNSFRLGKHVEPNQDKSVVWKSGWMLKRVKKWTGDNVCKEPKWLKLCHPDKPEDCVH